MGGGGEMYTCVGERCGFVVLMLLIVNIILSKQ